MCFGARPFSNGRLSFASVASAKGGAARRDPLGFLHHARHARPLGAQGGTADVAGTVDGARSPSFLVTVVSFVLTSCAPLPAQFLQFPPWSQKFDESDGSLECKTRNVSNVGTTSTLAFDAKPRCLQQARFAGPTLQADGTLQQERQVSFCPNNDPVPTTSPLFRSFVAQAACGAFSSPCQSELANVYVWCGLPANFLSATAGKALCCRQEGCVAVSNLEESFLRSPSFLSGWTRTWQTWRTTPSLRLESGSGSTEVEQNQWSAMLGLCFHHVVPPRFILAAGPCSVATLSAACMFACDVLNGPRKNQVTEGFSARQERLLVPVVTPSA